MADGWQDIRDHNHTVVALGIHRGPQTPGAALISCPTGAELMSCVLLRPTCRVVSMGCTWAGPRRIISPTEMLQGTAEYASHVCSATDPVPFEPVGNSHVGGHPPAQIRAKSNALGQFESAEPPWPSPRGAGGTSASANPSGSAVAQFHQPAHRLPTTFVPFGLTESNPATPLRLSNEFIVVA